MVQTWFYYLGYPADPWHVKSLVYILTLSHVLCVTHFKVLAVFISDTIHQALITHSGEHRTSAFVAFGRALIVISTSLRLPRDGRCSPNSAWKSCLVSSSCCMILSFLIALQESRCKSPASFSTCSLNDLTGYQVEVLFNVHAQRSPPLKRLM